MCRRPGSAFVRSGSRQTQWEGGAPPLQLPPCPPPRPSRAPSPMSGDSPGPPHPGVLLVVAGGLLLMHLPPSWSCSQVETEDRFEWIGGSSIGGGTFWGLGALLTKTKVPWQLQEDAPGSVWLSPGPFRKGLVPAGSEAVPGGDCHQSASFLGLVPPLFPGSLRTGVQSPGAWPTWGVPEALPVSPSHAQLVSLRAWFPGP